MPNSFAVPILESKLYQPNTTRGSIHRDRLFEAIPRMVGGGVTVVSAPAGYGKSSFISDDIRSSQRSCAWLSIDSADSDCKRFTSYLLAALRTVIPDCCMHTGEYLQSNVDLSVDELSALLCNDLEQLGQPVTLVLDDYDPITGPDAQDLLNEVLRHPSRYLHLIIVTRRDPPLALMSLHTNGRLQEVRMQQLPDQAALSGVLSTLDDKQYPVLSVECLEAD